MHGLIWLYSGLMLYTQLQVEYCLNKSMTISLSRTPILVDYLETIFFNHVQIFSNVFLYSRKKIGVYGVPEYSRSLDIQYSHSNLPQLFSA